MHGFVQVIYSTSNLVVFQRRLTEVSKWQTEPAKGKKSGGKRGGVWESRMWFKRPCLWAVTSCSCADSDGSATISWALRDKVVYCIPSIVNMTKLLMKKVDESIQTHDIRRCNNLLWQVKRCIPQAGHGRAVVNHALHLKPFSVSWDSEAQMSFFRTKWHLAAKVGDTLHDKQEFPNSLLESAVKTISMFKR